MYGVDAMRKTATAASVAAIFLFGTASVLAQQSPNAGAAAPPQSSIKLSAAECQGIWQKADAAKAGSLTMAQAQPYVSDFKSVDSNGDGKLTSSEFLAGCEKGLAHGSASSGASSGTSGAGAGAGADKE